MQIEHKKNSAYYLAFPMVDDTTPASFKTGLSPTDIGYYKDGAGAWTSLVIADSATEIASTGVYEIDLSASELNHDQVIIKFTGTGAAESVFLLDMRAKLVDDLNDITAVNVRTEIDSNSTQLSAIITDLDDVKGTGFIKDTNSLVDLPLASDYTSARAGYLDSINGHIAQTGDTFALANGANGFANIKSDTGNILTDTGTTLDNHLTDIKGTTFVKDTHSLTNIEGYADLIDDGTNGLAAIKTAIDNLQILDATATAAAVWNAVQATYATPGTFGEIATEIAAVLLDTDELQQDNIPATLATLATASALTTVDTEVGQIKAVTDLLPDAGALTSLATAAALTTVDTEVGNIYNQTNSTGVAISTATAQAIADELLKRDWNSVSGEAARSVLNALRILRNKSSVAGSTLTVTQEDDVATAWTATVTSDAAADPITAIDPV